MYEIVSCVSCHTKLRVLNLYSADGTSTKVYDCI